MDEPLWKQYLLWLGNLFFRGDLGTSVFFPRTGVKSVIGDGAETSILLATMTMFWIVLFGIPIGILSATRHGTWVDQVTSGGAMLFASVPTFWLGLYLILIFSVGLGWFPKLGVSVDQRRRRPGRTCAISSFQASPLQPPMPR